MKHYDLMVNITYYRRIHYYNIITSESRTSERNIKWYNSFSSIHDNSSSEYKRDDIGEYNPLTVSSWLRCPLSIPPILLHLPISTAGILTKARDVHASSEGLDETQYAEEDSFSIIFCKYRVNTV